MPNVSIQTILQNNLPKGYTGSRGDTGFIGSAGDQGYTGSLGYTGSIGFTGSAGPQGVSIRILGVLELIADLPSDGTSDGSTPLVSGDSFIVEEDGNLYSWNGLDWVNGGRIQGYTGSVGFVGSQGDLGYTGSQGDIGYTGSIGDTGYTGSQGDLGYTGSIGGFAAVQGLTSVDSLTYTFQLTDAGRIVEFTANGNVTATIPNDSSLNFLLGQRIDISQSGLGTLDIAAEAGVTIYSNGNNYLADQYQTGSLVKLGANEWLFVGPQSVGYTGSQGYTGSIGFTGSLGFTGSEGGLASIQDINEQTGISYVLQTSDAGKLVQLTNSSDINLTIPNDGALGAEIGQRIDLTQGGTGAVYFQLGTGVQLRYANADYLNEQYASGTLIKLDVNEWLFVGPQATGYTGSSGFTGSAGFAGSRGYTGSEGTLASIQDINAQTGTSYTFAGSDAGKLVTFTNEDEVTVTVPADSSVTFDIGRRIDIQQGGNGQVTLNPENGVVVYSTTGLYINQIYSAGTLIKVAANEWSFISPAEAAGYTGSQANLDAVDQNIIPATDETYDLGSPEKAWRRLYVSANTIFLGGSSLSVDEENNQLVLTTNGETIEIGGAGGGGTSYDEPAASTGYFGLPVGTTAQRPGTPAVGMVRYNSTLGAAEFYTAAGWSPYGGLAISTVTPTSFSGESGTQFTVNGSGFIAGTTVKFATSAQVEYTAASILINSTNQIVCTTPRNFTVAEEPLRIKVISPGGLSITSADEIDCGGSPAWVTAAGSLGTVLNGDSATISLEATDPDQQALTYSVSLGSLPNGLSLNSSTGAITGTLAETNPYSINGVTYNFDITASDSVNESSRSFTILTKWRDGSTSALAAASAQDIYDLGITTNGIYYLRFQSGYTDPFQVYCVMDELGGAWMLAATVTNTGGDRVDWFKGDSSRSGATDPVTGTDWFLADYTNNLNLATGAEASLQKTNYRGPVFTSFAGTSIMIVENYDNVERKKAYLLNDTKSLLGWFTDTASHVGYNNKVTSVIGTSGTAGTGAINSNTIDFNHSLANDGGRLVTTAIGNEASGGWGTRVDSGSGAYQWEGNLTRDNSPVYSQDGTNTNHTWWVFVR